MSVKIIVLTVSALIVVVASDHKATSYASIHNQNVPGSDGGHGGGLGAHGSGHGHEQHYPHHHPKYEFEYGVDDSHTHDRKSQQEHRDGDAVKGWYKLDQPDGRTRIVHYNSDKHAGFNANVEYSGHAVHPYVKNHH